MTKKKLGRYFYRAAYIIVGVIVFAHGGSAITADRMLHYSEITYRSPHISPDLDGYVICFVADTHDISMKKLEKAVERINARNIDLVLLGGDYQDEDAEPTMAAISKINAPDGFIGVEGNHDISSNFGEAMDKYGMVQLRNTGVRVRPGLYVGGVTFLWEGGKQVENALKDAPPEDFALLLAHTPDIAMQQDTSRAEIMLSGHTHGGQITFFGLWAPALKYITMYGHKFKSGWAEGQFGTKVYTSRGVWHMAGSMRIFARPEIVFLTLKSANE